MAGRAVGIAAEKQEIYKQIIRVRNALIPA
jgi:hypothetical protein